MQRHRWTTSLATAIVIVTAIAGVACRRVQAPEVEPAASPDPISTVVASPVPLTSAQLEGEKVYYVVGSTGVVGSDGLNTGTRSFTITNNDDRPHDLEFVRFRGPRDVADVQAAVRGGDWPAPWAEVLHRTGEMDERQTVTVKTPPLVAGYYALVDMQVRSGRPLATQATFVKPIEVAEVPS